MKAGFAEIDITPPLGVKKIGWIKTIISDCILDPLFARAAVFESGRQKAAFVQLDLLCFPAPSVAEVRRRIEVGTGFPGRNIMVAATHNHAGPAVATLGDVPRDEAYFQVLLARIDALFEQAVENLADAEVGLGSCFEFNVAHNRRVVLRDGTVRTHGTFNDPNALFLEGPIDPEVGVLGARSPGGEPLGLLVNYACHPCQHGGETALSAGFPGVLANLAKQRGWPVTLFLNGALGNQHTADPARGVDMPMEEAGAALADDVTDALKGMAFRERAALGCASRTVQLPYRTATGEQIAGTARGAQRFVDPTSYDRHIPALLEEIRQRGTQPAEVQAISIAEHAFVGLPGECFVELGLKIKERCHPRHALVVGNANGMVGYVPHKEGFARGGYETTFSPWSKLAPEAGDMLVDCAVELVRTA